jgi:hypothetical protein
MYGWMDGWMDVCMYAWMYGCMYIHFSSISFPFHLFMLIFIFTSYLYASHPFHSHLISISTPHSTSLHSTPLPFTSPFTFTNIPKFTYTNPFNIHFILFSTFHSHIHSHLPSHPIHTYTFHHLNSTQLNSTQMYVLHHILLIRKLHAICFLSTPSPLSTSSHPISPFHSHQHLVLFSSIPFAILSFAILSYLI